MFSQQSEQRHPFTSLVLLLVIALASFVLLAFMAYFLGYLIFGPDELLGLRDGTAGIGIQKLFLTFSSIGMFVLPPFIFARLERRAPFAYLRMNMPSPRILLVLGLVIMIFVTPFIEWTVLLNQQMKLPEFLEPIERWMQYKEISAEILTKKLLVMNSVGGLLLNLIIIAVIPAIGEEFFFRGCIQKIFSRWTNDPHVGIWIAAIIFSTIHVQFFGFIPRMLLGALFGYMLMLSKSIWVPVLAHFYNNASAVIAAYVLQHQGKSLDNLTKPAIQNWYLVILSVIFTVLLFTIFKRISMNTNEKVNERGLE